MPVVNCDITLVMISIAIFFLVYYGSKLGSLHIVTNPCIFKFSKRISEFFAHFTINNVILNKICNFFYNCNFCRMVCKSKHVKTFLILMSRMNTLENPIIFGLKMISFIFIHIQFRKIYLY